MRKDWDAYFMEIAKVTAERATCNRLKVGAVIVNHNKIVSTGYNGSIHGHDHCTEVGCLLNEQGRCIRTIHAEMNAILHADRDKLEGATIYVTHEPCELCSKLIAQAGIKRVVYLEPYNNKWNQYFLKDLEVIQYVEKTTMQDQEAT
jgi:dCMP deaminase